MKLFLALFAVMLTLHANAQLDSSFKYTSIITLADAPQSKIFAIADEWLRGTKLLMGTRDMVEQAVTGEIEGLGVFSASGYNKGDVLFDYRVVARDGKCKFVMTNFRHRLGAYSCGDLNRADCPVSHMFISSKLWERIRADAHKRAMDILSDFTSKMSRLIQKKEDF